ncbi:HAD family hydrolase [Ramlibacter sp. MMS24-I3-19]|uniref:HAD family hydrolase n=1 Tax=Ramlibacter sp. MMS24-I3-19 TaxID=3416606 RepID=UPI003D085FDD
MQPTFTPPIRAVCFDWGGTLMSEAGPADMPMGVWPEVRAMTGARDALAMLHGHVPLCIATNASVSDTSQIERALARVGLGQFFSHVFCYTELGCRKDQPAFWRAVSERLDVPATSIAMVGDSLDQDMRGPARFGVQSVWFSATAALGERDVPRVAQLPEFARLVLQAL